LRIPVVVIQDGEVLAFDGGQSAQRLVLRLPAGLSMTRMVSILGKVRLVSGERSMALWRTRMTSKRP